jgi:hypothetical protein
MRWGRTKRPDTVDEAVPDPDDSAARSSPAADEVAEPARHGSSPRRHPADDTPPAGRPAASLGVELREEYGLVDESPWPRGHQSYLDESAWAAQPTPRRRPNFYGR